MTDIEKEFLNLAVVEQIKYAEIEKILVVERKQLTQWWEDLILEREELSKIRKIWTKKCKHTNFWDFHNWYIKTERKCAYCGITEIEIAGLIAANQIHTKRLPNRGKNLEIERKMPNESYDNLNNLLFSCYWCNNAKTDEFTFEEFLSIGKQIGMIWKKRLKR